MIRENGTDEQLLDSAMQLPSVVCPHCHRSTLRTDRVDCACGSTFRYGRWFSGYMLGGVPLLDDFVQDTASITGLLLPQRALVTKIIEHLVNKHRTKNDL